MWRNDKSSNVKPQYTIKKNWLRGITAEKETTNRKLVFLRSGMLRKDNATDACP
jgi:hypothetical protein